VCCPDNNGRQCEIPLGWTGLAPEDALIMSAAGNKCFRAAALFELARLPERLRRSRGSCGTIFPTLGRRDDAHDEGGVVGRCAGRNPVPVLPGLVGGSKTPFCSKSVRQSSSPAKVQKGRKRGALVAVLEVRRQNRALAKNGADRVICAPVVPVPS
jgi:hypothetical protein